MSANSTTSAPPSSHPSFWWFHGIDAFLFFLMGAAALIRIIRRLGFSENDNVATGSLRPLTSTAELLRELPQRQRHVVMIFAVLTVYGILRGVTEGLISSDFVSGVGTFEWSTITSVPAALFALVQTCMIARWVHTVEELMYEVRHTTFRLGAIAVASSAVCLVGFVLLTLFSIPDTQRGLTGLSSDDWLELLSLFQGILYTYNGVCFLVLGLQMVCFWDTASESTRDTRRRILAIALVFCFLCVCRGVVLCVFSFSMRSEHLHAVMDSSWGAPAVLLVEWFCLVIAFFVLTPSGARNEPSTSVANSLSEVPAELRYAEANRWSGSGAPTAAHLSGREPRTVEVMRSHYMQSVRQGSFSGSFSDNRRSKEAI